MAYVLLTAQDTRRLALMVNVKQAAGYAPAGGMTFNNGLYYQFVSNIGTPSNVQLYGIVIAQTDEEFNQRASLLSGVALGTMSHHKSFFMQAFGTPVNAGGGLTTPVTVANGGTGATNAADARLNLGFTNAGIGGSVIPIQSSMDWQTFEFMSGGTYIVAVSSMTNTPAALAAIFSTSNSTLFIDVLGTRGLASLNSVRVSASTSNNAVFRVVEMTFQGTQGSRTFYVRELYSSGTNSIVPVTNGGTGATNAADALLNLGAAAASDESIKHDIADYDGVTSLNNILAIRPRTFVFNDDAEGVTRRGVIAQEMATIDPEYVTQAHRNYVYNEDGEVVSSDPVLMLDNNVLLMDALIAIKVLAERVAELEDKSK